jgi:hypothetical protein
MAATIDLAFYAVTDGFFGPPFVDVDEERAEPSAHRYLHGGFEGTDTRFSFYFPPVERYGGRLFQPLEGGNAGHETLQSGPISAGTGGPEMAFRLGGYMVESNMGHIGDLFDPTAGPDPTLYGWRAAAEVARLSKFVAVQVLGTAPRRAYVFGGSGGARRSPLCLAYAPGVWDAAMPFMGDAMDGDHGDFRLLRSGTPNFSSMFNVQRLLGPLIFDVVDAMWPGGSGDPFAALDTHQREELATLYRLGYPRGDEYMIAQPMGQMWLWASMADRLQADYPEYWEAFWTRPGYVGHDHRELLEGDLIDIRTTVVRCLFPKDLMEEAEFQGPEFAQMRAIAALFAAAKDAWDLPMAIQLDLEPAGYRLGAGVSVIDGHAAGRQLYCMTSADTVWLCDGAGEANNLRFSGVLPGDAVHLDNRAFLAYCYFYRHHLLPHAEYRFLEVDGRPVHHQHELPEMSPFMGTVHSAEYEGKLMWIHNTHDASLWPAQGVGFKANVERVHGPDEAARRFRLRWTENAEHILPGMGASPPGRANNTWLVDFQPVIEQSLVDLIAWVEEDVPPIGTNFELRDGKIVLPASAEERGGIQPVVTVTANGVSRAEVAAGEEVMLRAEAAVPSGTGTVVAVRWDFDGSGSYPWEDEVDGTSASVTSTTTHRYSRPGTYFATALVESHREGDTQATSRRIPNLASARIVVR